MEILLTNANDDNGGGEGDTEIEFLRNRVV
jgi:hypothetical protein